MFQGAGAVLRRHRTSLLAATIVVLTATSAQANSTGINGFSGKDGFNCNSCHMGGTAPTVTLQGPQTLDVGQSGVFTLTVHSNRRTQQRHGGLNVASNGGTFIAGSGTRILGGELTHNQPRMNDGNDNAVFSFQWTAPVSAGTYTLWAAGNSVNLNGANSGDLAATTTLSVVVGKSASPTPTHTFTVIPTTTPTLTPSATASPTDTASPTATPSPTSTATETAVPLTTTPTPTPTATRTPTLAVTPGDVNCNQRVSAADLVHLVAYILRCDAECSSVGAPLCSADFNRDERLDAGDIEALLGALF